MNSAQQQRPPVVQHCSVKAAAPFTRGLATSATPDSEVDREMDIGATGNEGSRTSIASLPGALHGILHPMALLGRSRTAGS